MLQNVMPLQKNWDKSALDDLWIENIHKLNLFW